MSEIVPEDVIKNVSEISEILNNKVAVMTELVASIQSNLESLLQSSHEEIQSITSIFKSPEINNVQKIIKDLASTVENLPSVISETVGSIPSQISVFIKKLPSILINSIPSGISAMAQSLPAAIMSALPSGLGGGALPSLVSTLPSQLSGIIPGGLGSLKGLTDSLKYQQEAVHAHMPKVLASLVSPYAISSVGRQLPTLPAAHSLAGPLKDTAEEAQAVAKEPKFYDKFDRINEFKMRNIELESDLPTQGAEKPETDDQDLETIRQRLEVILAGELNRYTGGNDPRTEIVSHEPDNLPMSNYSVEDNIRWLKRSFEEILIKEFKRYGGNLL